MTVWHLILAKRHYWKRIELPSLKQSLTLLIRSWVATESATCIYFITTQVKQPKWKDFPHIWEDKKVHSDVNYFFYNAAMHRLIYTEVCREKIMVVFNIWWRNFVQGGGQSNCWWMTFCAQLSALIIACTCFWSNLQVQSNLRNNNVSFFYLVVVRQAMNFRTIVLRCNVIG